MKLIADATIPALDACFSAFGTIERLPGRAMRAEQVRNADALIVRSITPVDAALLEGSSVHFVGTCTIGTDHLDLDYLDAHGISVANAPGCNAEAVVDYVLMSLLTLAERGGWRLGERCVGVVGVGNVGGRLVARLNALGVEVLCCDPPRAEREGGDGFVELDTLIERCDVLCFHAPLVREGPHRTQYLLDAERIAALAPHSVLLNAGRGDCIDGLALRNRLAGQNDLSVVLDVWEHEPDIDASLRDLVALATPHIAGHSLDGKLRGTWMIQQALAAHLGRDIEGSFSALCPPAAVPALTLSHALPVEDALRLCMRAVYDVRRDHDSLHREVLMQGIRKGFDHCRAHYPLRREFATLEVTLVGEAAELASPLRAAGFCVTLA
ncbi:4-phosphoerythronate dehydrogenase PdxB [Halomonas dongshanensis]|uniref:Erythronate-4-phosphate dehydrogenase n=1 Tax=Halomonas dongshanensis TaxID=2890835 RepID=A0ABT2EBV5_9GAMM|nr:4-phosphoerythronate dehydrogenase PdxB [Halomonas dongshanensis]